MDRNHYRVTRPAAASTDPNCRKHVAAQTTSFREARPNHVTRRSCEHAPTHVISLSLINHTHTNVHIRPHTNDYLTLYHVPCSIKRFRT